MLDLSIRYRCETGKCVQQGGFALTRGSDQRDNFTLVDFEIQPRDYGFSAALDREVSYDSCEISDLRLPSVGACTERNSDSRMRREVALAV